MLENVAILYQNIDFKCGISIEMVLILRKPHHPATMSTLYVHTLRSPLRENEILHVVSRGGRNTQIFYLR